VDNTISKQSIAGRFEASALFRLAAYSDEFPTPTTEPSAGHYPPGPLTGGEV
jgi:hypothetical protein